MESPQKPNPTPENTGNEPKTPDFGFGPEINADIAEGIKRVSQIQEENMRSGQQLAGMLGQVLRNRTNEQNRTASPGRPPQAQIKANNQPITINTKNIGGKFVPLEAQEKIKDSMEITMGMFVRNKALAEINNFCSSNGITINDISEERFPLNSIIHYKITGEPRKIENLRNYVKQVLMSRNIKI